MSTATRRKAWLFLMRLMYSGRDFAWIYERQDQVSFLDGHVRAFAHFGGVPARLAYDNLRGGGGPDPGRRRADADAALCGAGVALPVRAVLLSAGRRATTRAASKRAARPLRRQALVPIPSGADARGDQCRRCSRGWMRASTRARWRRRDDRRALRGGSSAPVAAACRRRLSPRRRRSRRSARARSCASRARGTRCRVAGPGSISSRASAPTTVTIVGRDGTPHRASAQALRRAVDRLPALPAGAGAQAAGGAPGPAGAAARSRARRFPRSGRACTRRTARARPRGSSPKILGRARHAWRGRGRAGPARARWPTGTPLPLALDRRRRPRGSRSTCPRPLRDLDVASGCAADYDGWLTGVPA